MVPLTQLKSRLGFRFQIFAIRSRQTCGCRSPRGEAFAGTGRM